jgi:anti-sigma28 factor (negative regulator of flagellin synthesis)
MDTIDIIYIAFLTLMNNIKKITSLSLVAGMFLIAALATSAAHRTAFAQNMSNQTVANQTSSAMNQTSSAMNQTSTNQTSAEPKLTTSDVQDIRKSLEEIRKDIADGKATEALQAINDIDDKMLVSMSKNPPPMLDKSSGNDNNNK